MSARDEWKRLAGRHRTRAIEKGLQARMADGFWMLARQWQFGEFKGEDAASPARAQVGWVSAPVDTFIGYNAAGKPSLRRSIADDELLEVAVEREAVTDGFAALKFSAEAGIQFIRRLPKEYRERALTALREHYPLTLEGSTYAGKAAFLKLLLERSFDAAVFFHVQASALTALARRLSLDEAMVNATFASWQDYYRARFSEPTREGVTWRDDRLEYRFGISASPDEKTQVALVAEEYPGGRLDWYHCDMSGKLSKGLKRKLEANSEAWMIPAPVRYAGMPADRFWDFEDGQVSFGGLSAGATDLAQTLVTEFATVYSNDWYQLPLTVPVGSLSRVLALTIYDSFGEAHTIKPTAVKDGEGRSWKWFELTGDPSVGHKFSPWVYVPRTVLGGHEDRAVERVVFTRDEMANLAWGIEEFIEGRSGHSVSRRLEWMKRRESVVSALSVSENANASEAWRYRLLSTVPPYWVPFAPEVEDNRVTNRLIRSRMREWDLLGEEKAILAGGKGAILQPTQPMALQEEEIPRGAIEVTRSYQAARNAAGELVVWMGRRKRPASGDRASGRKTDQVEMEEATNG